MFNFLIRGCRPTVWSFRFKLANSSFMFSCLFCYTINSFNLKSGWTDPHPWLFEKKLSCYIKFFSTLLDVFQNYFIYYQEIVKHRVRFRDLTTYVGWVRCWFSSLPQGSFSGFSAFPPSTKTNIPNPNSTRTQWTGRATS